MGQHFVPQRYLRPFQSPSNPGNIWAFDKEQKTRKLLPIKRVAQAPEFYTPEIETELNHEVEIPGLDVIDRIVRGESISEEDRRHLSYYIATQIRRVPNARANAGRLVPGAINENAEEVKEGMRQAAAAGLMTPERLAERLVEVDESRLRLLANPPENVRQVIETPWPFESMLFAVHSMHWRVLRASGPTLFLTGDNPAMFFEGFGLGNAEAELILPLTPGLLLHCSWQECPDFQRLDLEDRLVKEMNRRIVVGATRFVYSHQNADWVFKVAQNKPEQLSRIRWR